MLFAKKINFRFVYTVFIWNLIEHNVVDVVVFSRSDRSDPSMRAHMCINFSLHFHIMRFIQINCSRRKVIEEDEHAINSSYSVFLSRSQQSRAHS